MGYTTDFWGEFTCEPALTPEHRAYLKAFAETRRVKRNPDIAETLPDPIRLAAGLPIGIEGAYFVGGAGFRGQDDDASVIDGNEPPGVPSFPKGNGMENFGQRYAEFEVLKSKAITLGAQPGLWCQWTPNEDGTAIVWDEGEKFYEYIPWIQYLLDHFLKPWGYVLNGTVNWEGEESGDIGVIRITNNVVEIGHGVIQYQF